jgi:Protein of unknown function (DUF4238)
VSHDARGFREFLIRGSQVRVLQGAASYFSQFVALMIVRTPAMRRMYAEIIGRGFQIRKYAYTIHDQAFESLIRRVEKHSRQKLDEAIKARVRKKMLDPSDYAVVLSQQATFGALEMADTLAPLFFDMHWSIIRAKHGFFITSDNPVVREVEPENAIAVLRGWGLHE